MSTTAEQEALHSVLAKLGRCQQLVQQPQLSMDTLVEMELLLGDAIAEIRIALGLKKWPEPTVEPPDWETIEEWLREDGGCEATDSCWVEPDGTCMHGHPSWLLKLGLI